PPPDRCRVGGRRAPRPDRGRRRAQAPDRGARPGGGALRRGRGGPLARALQAAARAMSRRRYAVIAVLVLAAGVATGLFLSNRHSNPAVAHINGEAIRRDQLAIAVDHFRKEAEKEGTPFPEENSARFRSLRNRLLGVLVYRAEIGQAAERLGVGV